MQRRQAQAFTHRTRRLNPDQRRPAADPALAWGIEHARLSFETDPAGNRLFINR